MLPAVGLSTKIAAAVSALCLGTVLGTVGYFVVYKKKHLTPDQQTAVDTGLTSADPQGAANLANTLQSQGHDDAAAQVAAHAQALSNATGTPIDTGTAPSPPDVADDDADLDAAAPPGARAPPDPSGGWGWDRRHRRWRMRRGFAGARAGGLVGRPGYLVPPPAGRVNLWRNARVHALHPAWTAHAQRTIQNRGRGGHRGGLPREGVPAAQRPVGRIPLPGTARAAGPGRPQARPASPPPRRAPSPAHQAARAGTAALDPVAHLAHQATGGASQIAAGTVAHAGQTIASSTARDVANVAAKAAAPAVASAAHAAQQGLHNLLNDMSGGAAPVAAAPLGTDANPIDLGEV